MSCFLKSVLGTALTLLLAALLVPQYSDYRARAETDGWLEWVAPLQREIEAVVLRRGEPQGGGSPRGIPQAVSPPGERPASLTRFMVQDTGEILMIGGIDGQMLVLTPTRSPTDRGGNIVWQCLGAPDRAMPPRCRANPPRHP